MIIIKKYNNRRLYNTSSNKYINLGDIYQMIKNDVEFNVIDAINKKDITRIILTQIIFERENGNNNILPINFLKQLIKFYDGDLCNILAQYLENSLINFVKDQEVILDLTRRYIDDFSYFKFFNQLTKQNLKFIQDNIKNFMGK